MSKKEALAKLLSLFDELGHQLSIADFEMLMGMLEKNLIPAAKLLNKTYQLEGDLHE